MKGFLEKEEDKQNLVSNRREEQKRSVSITAKRDLSETKKGSTLNVTGYLDRGGITGSKTPTRSRVTKIALNLTPNNREHERQERQYERDKKEKEQRR